MSLVTGMNPTTSDITKMTTPQNPVEIGTMTIRKTITVRFIFLWSILEMSLEAYLPLIMVK